MAGSARPHERFTEDGRRIREVLSYSRRGSRFTPSQQAAWNAHAADWVVDESTVGSGDGGRACRDFSLADCFGREAPLIVEIGSGVGEATAALAAARPSVDVLALEVWRPGIASTLERLDAAHVTNVRLCAVDAVWALEHLILPHSLAALWVFFPDPWPKTRHHKRRLVTSSFAALAASCLAPGAEWRLATDWDHYAEQIAAVLDAEPLLTGGAVERWAERPVTKFERKALEAGRTITDFCYRLA